MEWNCNFQQKWNETKIKWSEMNDGNGVCTLKMLTHFPHSHTFHVVFDGIQNWNLIALQMQTQTNFFHSLPPRHETRVPKSKQSILKIRCKFPNNILLYWMYYICSISCKLIHMSIYIYIYISGIALNRDVHL